MLALVSTFADLPLSTRAAAAVNAIDAYPLTIRQRCELVALAVWPTDATLSGPVKLGSRVPDVDRRPARRETVSRGTQSSATPAAVLEPPRSILEADPVELRERLSRGDTITEIAADFGVPSATARGWIRRSDTARP